MEPVRNAYIPMVAAMRSYYRGRNNVVFQLADQLLKDLLKEFGSLKMRLFSYVGAKYLRYTIWREEKRLARGVTYEPPTFYQRNAFVQDESIELASAVEPLVMERVSEMENTASSETSKEMERQMQLVG